MKNRFSKRNKLWMSVLGLLMLGGMMHSCKDSYTLDDGGLPDFLGASIYSELKNPSDGALGKFGTFNYFVRLIDDCGYADVLNRTGSKTLFVVNDDTFQKYLNRKGTTYEQLTLDQKKLLLYSYMLPDANLMEMLANVTNSAAGDKNEPVKKDVAIRRKSDYDLLLGLGWVYDKDLPTNYHDNDNPNLTAYTAEGDYWDQFHVTRKSGEAGTDGLVMASDGTDPMIVFLMQSTLAQNNITGDDFKALTGRNLGAGESYFYNCKIIGQDVTCLNGYVHVLDSLVELPGNMAEMIRTNGKTNIFSHILDRFSAPFFSSTLTNDYRGTHPDVDQSIKVYEKRYFSERSKGGSSNTKNPDLDYADSRIVKENSTAATLKFDPGWNQYYPNITGTTNMTDMGAMLVPKDDVLRDYFVNGGGRALIDRFTKGLNLDPAASDEDLLKCIDQIPLDGIMNKFVNNMMSNSFAGSVPSKFSLLQDASTNDLIGVKKEMLDSTILSNNGPVYLMNAVYPPAAFRAVSAPLAYDENLRIINWAVINGESTEHKSPDLTLNYYAYLLAMSSKFTFFIPSDQAMGSYLCPLTFHPALMGISGVEFPMVLSYIYNADKPAYSDQISGKYAKYGTDVSKGKTWSASFWPLYLRDILEQHTIVHNADEYKTGLSTKHWWLAKNGAPIYIEHPENFVPGANLSGTASNQEVKGGLQIAEATAYPELTAKISNVYNMDGDADGNGWTYVIDHALEASHQSVYQVLVNNADCSDFLEQIMVSDADIISYLGGIPGYEEKTTRRKYRIMMNNSTKDDGTNFNTIYHDDPLKTDNLVRFFSAYNYTLYVPTNKAMDKAYALGLPKWDEVDALIQTMKNETPNDWQTRAEAMLTVMTNFSRYHFQQNSLFADIKPFSGQYESMAVDTVTNRGYALQVASNGANDLRVKGIGNVNYINVRTDAGDYNILARDMHLSKQVNATDMTSDDAMKIYQNKINFSAYTTIHKIDEPLHHVNLSAYPNKKYSDIWATKTAAQAYLKKYKLQN